MSLIHDALKESGAVAQPSRPAARGAWWARQPATTRRLLPAAAIVLAAVPVLLVQGLRNRHDDTAPAAAITAAPVAASPATALEPALPAVSLTGSETVPAPAPEAIAALDTLGRQLPEHLAENIPVAPPAAAPVMAPTLATAQPAPVPQNAEGTSTDNTSGHSTPPAAHTARATAPEIASQPMSIKVERRGVDGHAAGKANGAIDDVAVERAVVGIEAAMAAGDLPTAQQTMTQLETLLPAESLTLLRMQAWLSHAGGDGGAAERLYRKIAERVPGDINAGVNIALLEARRGELDDARRRLAQLSGRHPRSPQVVRALAELEDAQP